MAVKGIDVSGWNANPDWAAVAAGGDILYVIAKATEGMTYNDKTFARNWSEIKAAGLVRGAYHYARPSNNGAVDEADHFLGQVNAAGGLEAGDLLALDMEDTSAMGNLHDWTLSWLQHVENQVGFKPLFYSGTWYMNPHGLTGVDDLAEYPLWFSRYNRIFNQVPAAPANWSRILIHQYDDKGTVAGIAGKVDMNCFVGNSADELRGYGAPGAPASTPATPTPNTYVVQPGDTWDSIAWWYGVTVGDLMGANPNIDQLATGMVINIPTMAMA